MPIIITENGNVSRKLNESFFANEDGLQNFIHNNPDCIPLYEIDNEIRLLILAREVPTKSGPIDAFGIDANGEAYIIETKLYKNPDKRLVVAQVLDYGASISENRDSAEEFYQSIENKVNHYFKISIQEKVIDFYNIPDEEANKIVDTFRANIAEGRLRYIVLMDHLEKRLKDLITYLNKNCKFDIFGVELKYYKYDKFEITIPKMFGTEIKKEIAVKRSGDYGKSWDEETFFAETRKVLGEGFSNNIQDFYNFFNSEKFTINWGKGTKRGSFNPIYESIGSKSLLSVFTDGSLRLNFAWFDNTDSQKSLQNKYKELFGEIFPLSLEVERAKFPVLKFEEWVVKRAEIQKSISFLMSVTYQ